MTLQWTFVATLLYVEVFILAIFLLPWIRPRMWQKVFNSRLAKMISAYAQIYTWVGAGALVLLFFDAVREVRKYGEVDMNLEAQLHAGANADAVIHMRLFRAQRNLYISGFALFLWLVLRRIIALISHEAHLEAAATAAMAQAKNASDTARKLLDEQGNADGGDSKQVIGLKNQIEILSENLKKAEADKEAMKKQSEGLQREFDALTERLAELQDAADKKGD